MAVSSKSKALRLFSCLVLCAVALAVGSRASTLVAALDSFPANRVTPAQSVSRVPFCLPGEKVKCTLGPPPVCHCE
jgi:hypothetical protein